MIYTLEQLSNGEVACTNDGTLEQMIAVLKHCFPNDNNEIKESFYDYAVFSKHYYLDNEWQAMIFKTKLPTQSVVEFYKQIQPQFEIGCWYESKGSKGLFIKVKSLLENGSTNKTDTIWSNGEFTENTDYRNIIQNWIKLENLSEIKQFLPPNHPDLITINKQYLTRKQLIELHKADSCPEWKQETLNIINTHHTKYPLALDESNVEIEQRYIDLINSKGGSAQKQLLQNLGIKLSNEVSVCDSKDGDCVKLSDTEYWINRNGFASMVRLNAANEYVVRTTRQSNLMSPDIRGELVKEPFLLQIKLN